MSTTHKLKLQENFVDRIATGQKSFEVRKFDRDFQVGDKIIFTDTHPIVNNYHHERELKYKEWEKLGEYEITYILTGWGIKDEHCVLSIKGIK